MPKATKVKHPAPAKGKQPAPRPTSVRIGHIDFAIRWISDEDWTTPNGQDPSLQGIFYRTDGRINIRVQKDVHEQTLRETLWHEIMHGCWWWMGMTDLPVAPGKDADDQEEDTVLRLTHASLLVMQENPEVMAYLSAGLFKKKVEQ
jgi:hypothetical protein